MPTKITFESKRVYGAVQRLLHLSVAGAVLVLMITGWGAQLLENRQVLRATSKVHLISGYLLLALLALRVLWGVVGPASARSGDFWHPHQWRLALFNQMKPAFRWGHDVRASAAYLVVYLAMLGLSFTGLGLAATEHDQGFTDFLRSWFDDVRLGEWFEGIHEVLALGVALFVFVHLLALWLHERFERTPKIQSMFTGFQYKPIQGEQLNDEIK